MNTLSSLVQPIGNLKPQSLSWLWPGRLALGKVSIFDGDPGLGKSLVTLDLCARLTTGRPFPDCGAAPEPRNVIILNGEDSAADIIAPRLRALGADLDRTFIADETFSHQDGPLRLPSQTALLDRALSQTGAALVVLDPITAFLDDSVIVSSDASVRRALLPLATLSDRHACHMILVRHLNKTGHFRALYRGGGSIGFLAACRSGYLFARDPNDPLRAVFAEVKNNLGLRQPSLMYQLQHHDSGQAIVAWLGPHTLSADQLLVAAGLKPPVPGPGERAREFVFEFLESGPRCTLDIYAAATQRRFSKRTLQRVRKSNDIRKKTIWVNNRLLSYWLLPGQSLSADLDPPKSDIPSLEPWLAPLRAQYPDDPLADDP
jgi:hypothetical protein